MDLINSFGRASPRIRFRFVNLVGPGSGVATPRPGGPSSNKLLAVTASNTLKAKQFLCFLLVGVKAPYACVV